MLGRATDYDPVDDDTHELQPLKSSTSSSHRRHNRSPGKSGTVDSESEDYDEDFADETFRLRGPNGDSLELDRDKAEGEEGEDEEVPIIRRGERRSNIKEEIPTDDPAALIHSIVAETDDPTLPAFTIRVIIIGSIFCILGAGLNQVRKA